MKISKLGGILSGIYTLSQLSLLYMAFTASGFQGLGYFFLVGWPWIHACELFNCFKYDWVELPLYYVAPLLIAVLLYYIGKLVESKIRRTNSAPRNI